MGKPKNFGPSQFNHMSLWRGSIDDIVVCPYDSTHVMKYGRLQLHIIKCQKAFENKNPELAKTFVICDYSTLHRFPKDKREEHLKECPEYIMTVHSRLIAGKGPVVQREPDQIDLHNLHLNEKLENFNPDYVQEWI